MQSQSDPQPSFEILQDSQSIKGGAGCDTLSHCRRFSGSCDNLRKCGNFVEKALTQLSEKVCRESQPVGI